MKNQVLESIRQDHHLLFMVLIWTNTCFNKELAYANSRIPNELENEYPICRWILFKAVKVRDMNSYRLSYILHFYTHMHTQPHRSLEKSVIPNFLKSVNWPIYLYLDENFDLVVVYNTAGKNSLKKRMKVNIWALWKWNDSNLIMIKVFGTTLIGIWKQWMWKTISIFHQLQHCNTTAVHKSKRLEFIIFWFSLWLYLLYTRQYFNSILYVINIFLIFYFKGMIREGNKPSYEPVKLTFCLAYSILNHTYELILRKNNPDSKLNQLGFVKCRTHQAF